MGDKKGRTGKAKRHAAQLQAAKHRNRALRPLGFGSLPSHRRKLAWAESHIQELEGLINNWLGQDPYRVTMEPDGKGGTDIVGQQVKDLPNTLGLIIGDAL